MQPSPAHLPMAAASVAAQTASSGSSHPLKRQSVVSRISSRLTSATNSGEQQRGDLSFDHVSGSQASSRAATGYQGRRGQRCSYPKWTCFAKTGSVLSNHLLVTFMPSSYQDLKQLILDDHALSGKEGAALKVIKTPIVQSSESEPSVVKPGMANNSILFRLLFCKSGKECLNRKGFSPPFLPATPSYPSRTLEGLFELTKRRSRPLDLVHACIWNYRETRTLSGVPR